MGSHVDKAAGEEGRKSPGPLGGRPELTRVLAADAVVLTAAV